MFTPIRFGSRSGSESGEIDTPFHFVVGAHACLEHVAAHAISMALDPVAAAIRENVVTDAAGIAPPQILVERPVVAFPDDGDPHVDAVFPHDFGQRPGRTCLYEFGTSAPNAGGLLGLRDAGMGVKSRHRATMATNKIRFRSITATS